MKLNVYLITLSFALFQVSLAESQQKIQALTLRAKPKLQGGSGSSSGYQNAQSQANQAINSGFASADESMQGAMQDADSGLTEGSDAMTEAQSIVDYWLGGSSNQRRDDEPIQQDANAANDGSFLQAMGTSVQAGKGAGRAWIAAHKQSLGKPTESDNESAKRDSSTDGAGEESDGAGEESDETEDETSQSTSKNPQEASGPMSSLPKGLDGWLASQGSAMFQKKRQSPASSAMDGANADINGAIQQANGELVNAQGTVDQHLGGSKRNGPADSAVGGMDHDALRRSVHMNKQKHQVPMNAAAPNDRREVSHQKRKKPTPASQPSYYNTQSINGLVNSKETQASVESAHGQAWLAGMTGKYARDNIVAKEAVASAQAVHAAMPVQQKRINHEADSYQQMRSNGAEHGSPGRLAALLALVDAGMVIAVVAMLL